MAVILTKEIKKKRLLLAVFGALVVVSLGILYFGGYFGSSTPAPIQPGQGSPVATTPGAAVVDQVSDLKVKILEDIRFQNLQMPPGVPIEMQTTGKSNPFSD
ncbi:MAG: hypothetical protein Q8Q90_01865 [bacterium]|nr:hypothetical protein [bacterium]